MDNDLRFNVADRRPEFSGEIPAEPFNQNQILEFNHRHHTAMGNYDLVLGGARILKLSDYNNHRSNLGSLRNRQLRESVILASGLSAMAVGLSGRASLAGVPKEKITSQLKNEKKRANDRTSAQIMAEVLHNTANTLPTGEEVLIASTITEGVRVKPGKEIGGNPTIAVGALYGKKEHRSRYGLPMNTDVSLLSMGTDVIDGTTKSVMGGHSSFTALFLTESGVKRHLPDIYVQRWMGGAYFDEFNPRDLDLLDAAEIIARSYGRSSAKGMSAFFLERNRHHLAMDTLNGAGVVIPYDTDGDLFPSLILGYDRVNFPGGGTFDSMIGEIGGSAEWAVGVLPLVWRGGQAIGMLTSQSALTRPDLSPEQKWNERFHFNEEEFIMMQDARFEQKPYFSIRDIMEDPFAGGIATFGGITDNYYLPFMNGVEINEAANTITVNVLVIYSMGTMEIWEMTFECQPGVARTRELMASPKEKLTATANGDLEKTIKSFMDNDWLRRRFRLFFNNEYYPALIPVRDKMVLLHNAIEALIGRGALNERDRDIIEITQKMASHWFVENH